MTITDVLKRKGLFSKDIRTRLKNGQIRVNDEVVKEDIDISRFDIQEIEENGESIFDYVVINAGDFIFHEIASNPLWITQCHIFGFENLFDTNIKNDLTLLLSQYNLLRISRKELLLILK